MFSQTPNKGNLGLMDSDKKEIEKGNLPSIAQLDE